MCNNRRHRGQALAEFALVVPVLMAIIGAIVQFGVLFWAQNTLTQVVRDTGRWEATQQSCTNGPALGTQAELIANNSSLMGHVAGEFSAPAVQTDDAAVNSFAAPNAIAVTWVKTSSETPPQTCPPSTNEAAWHVTIKMNHTVQTFFPGMQYLPGLGTCDGNGCHVVLSSTAQFRMEPKP